MINLFDLLEIEDYRQLFISNISFKFDRQWLESFAEICMKRYLDNENRIFISPQSRNSNEQVLSIVDKFKSKLIDLLKKKFKIEYFHEILKQIEFLNRFKYEQLSAQLNTNNHVIEQIRSILDLKDDNSSNKDDSIIHLSPTSPQTVARPTYTNYKPTHMIYVGDSILIRNDRDSRLPSKGIVNSFVADLINTKQINVLDENTGKSFEIPTKWLYFGKKCDKHVLLPLKLRVAVTDTSTGLYRYGLIGEEPGKNNEYRCLVFFTDDPENALANYHLSSQIHICLDQTHSTHTLEHPSDFLERYFTSYPERIMLRAKEGITVKVRNIFSSDKTNSSSFLSALVIQIDGSMMQIEFTHNKQRFWIYRGSPLLDQMHSYYSTQNRTVINGMTRQTARQHLSARRTNVPEIVCSNEQTGNRTKSVRTSEQIAEETSSLNSIEICLSKYFIIR